MEGQVKAKVTKVDYHDRSRPESPFKPQATSLSPPTMIRPKAKVSSGATLVTRKAPSTISTTPVNRNSGIPARSSSPFKQVQSGPTQTTSPSNAVKARLTPRPHTAQSAHPAPELRQRALTTIPSDSALSARTKPRRGSVSSHVTSPSHLDLHTPASSRLGASPTEEHGSPTSSVGKGLVRVKSKVSRGAESSPQPPSSVSSSPPFPTNGHSRIPSIPSISLAPPLHPANVNAPLAATASPLHHHRFATTRESHTHRPHHFDTFSSNDDLTIKYSGYIVAAKVDPAAIPLPPHSPPMSALSFSSRSSASRSSVSYETQTSEGASHPRSSSDGIRIHNEPVSREPSSPSDGSWDGDGGSETHELDDDLEDPDRKMKDEAKSNRKIEDLEISNRSLLVINTSLEATKHRQAKEIRDLRRKLRESRLILPPPAYRAVKSSLPPEDIAEDEDEDEDGGEDEQVIISGKDDEPYRRVKIMVEGLLESCRRALESKPADFIEGGKGGAKVLTAEEVRTWRGDNAETHSMPHVGADDTSHLGVEEDFDDRPLTPSRVAMPNSDDDVGSEDEVEASLLEPDIGVSATLPPITVTSSS